MRKNWKSKLMLLMLSLVIVACVKHNSADDDVYTCPMHPSVVQKNAGTCPVCGMDLVRKTSGEEAILTTEDISSLVKPTNARVVSSIKTVVPKKQNPAMAFRARGEVIHNAQTLGAIAATVSGRIEKLFVRSNFEPVKKGQRILTLYSPELIVAEEEYLALIKSDPSNRPLLESARVKLLLLGLSNDQINDLVKRKSASPTVTMFSPVDGYVATHDERDTAGSMGDETLRVREGVYVNKGQEIFTIVSHRDLWAEFVVYPRDVSLMKAGDTAVVTVDNSYGTMKATVDRIQPSFDNPSSPVKLRMRLINPHHQYHAGQHVTASFSPRADSTLWIPKSAQMNTGLNHIVFLKRGNTFKPIKISTGVNSADWVQVIAGLKPYDSIAYDASFLVDSDDFIHAN